MAKISLRAYFKKIEGLIDDGSNDEAINHCRYILKLYPKCIDAYRNLAKAHLEKKEYAEARDIFSRILSVFPDDFVSHIGLSIISETEGNLDAAIWHMELAYDIQPSNPVLTEELRRLFGRRDGVQPPKIRMSRGALIRMYARGELYQQVITECQSVLQDDPQRVDIEVILARVNYLAGSLVDSAEICSRILDRMPYCYEANRLMTQIIPRTGRSDDAIIYRLRLAELDPYFNHVTSPEMDSSDIPDGAILLDVLDESAQVDSFETPQWSKSNGFSWDDTQPFTTVNSESTPEMGKTDLPASVLPQIPGTSPLDPSSFDGEKSMLDDSFQKKINALDQETGALYNPQEIPAWILNAGWNAPGDASDEQLDNSTLSAENVNGGTDEAEPADLPAWLNNSQPIENSLPGMNDASQIALTEEISPTQPSSADAGPLEDDEQPESQIAAEDPEPQNSIPEKGETGEIMPSDSTNKNEEEWLNQLREDGPSSKDEQNDLPDWLKDFESENEQPLEENMDIPDWLKSLEPEESSQPEPRAADQPAEQIPAIDESDLKQEQGSAITGTSYVFTKMLMENETKAANLETSMLQPEPESPVENEPAASPVVPEFTPAKPAPEASAGLPSWVRNILKPQTPPAQAAVPPAEEIPLASQALPAVAPEIESQPTEAFVPESAQEVTPPEVPAATEAVAGEETALPLNEEPIHDLPTAVPEEGAITSETSSELLDWLRGFGENEEQPQEAVASTEEEETIAENVEESPLDRFGSYVEPVDATPPALPSDVAEASQMVEESVAQPVSEEAIQPAAEEKASDQQTSWFEEIPHEAEPEPVMETPESELVEPAASEEEVLAPAAEVEEPTQPSIEEPVAFVPEPAAVMEAVTPTHPVVSEPLSVAKNALDQGDLYLALNELNMTLQDESKIPEMIELLKTATSKYDQNSDLWMLLGDAYARTNQFGDAFDAYDRVETLLLKP